MTAPTIYTQATSRTTSARGALQKGPENSVPINQVIGTRALQGRPESHKEGHRTRARLCYSYRKPKGPVCEDTKNTRLQPPPTSGVLSCPNWSGARLRVLAWLWAGWAIP